MEERINIKEILNKYKGKKRELISLLQAIQDKYGYLPEESIRQLSRFLNVSENEVYGVATFYESFRLTPPGKHLITVCMGTACHVRGAPRVLEELQRELQIKEKETTKDGLFTLEIVNCVGACALGPIIIIDNQYYGQMTSQKARELLKKYREKERHGE
ncbi:NADH-quinone oxidoreductase subunit NuoE [Candidatus Aminicenantes bacterium AC-335-K20]|jgi:NADH-quinone oxidoreductase subunit E|nr:NADH-quinone oxidoreductase subunit NuoE [SCandidatus Aminicenantes bacterium Aminicenantia_JdfR_composite]MCP2619165.1 NADH-quinone oxidoreductase subunit NuoE [Candidatus Aminicenantes bacterium AC-335-K20]MCP2620654.1 NADH-quinone oxidoreductase subunit NuoE [Candidatus Aminicenantes bacterium AC-334-E05]